MTKIVSDIITITKPDSISGSILEDMLTEQYGEIIRWAVVDVIEDKFRISLSYIQDSI